MDPHPVAVESRHAAGIAHVGLRRKGSHGNHLILDLVLPDGVTELGGAGVGATGGNVTQDLATAEAAPALDDVPVGADDGRGLVVGV